MSFFAELPLSVELRLYVILLLSINFVLFYVIFAIFWFESKGKHKISANQPSILKTFFLLLSQKAPYINQRNISVNIVQFLLCYHDFNFGYQCQYFRVNEICE